jgi:hypothetical protein
MGSPDSGDSAFRVLRRHGAQPPFDIAAIAMELAQCQGDDAALCALFDWSQVSSWPFQAPPSAAVQTWSSTAPSVSRAAIIHDQKWDKHAAVLSALMRVRGGQVRSFHSLEHEKAVAWLNL